MNEEDEINVPMALSVFRDGSLLSNEKDEINVPNGAQRL